MTTITKAGETFSGSDGDDSVVILANDVVANGGAVNDWLATNIDITAEFEGGSEFTTELHGDEGDDHVQAILRAVNAGISASLFGEDGNDQIWLDIDSVDAPFASSISGDAGMDDIRVTAIGDGDTYYSGGPITVNAGDDDDTVHVETGGRSMNNIDVTAQAGNGNDFVEISTGYITIEGYLWGVGNLYGGARNDTLIGNAAGQNEAEGSTGNDNITLAGAFNTASGGLGNDWIKATTGVDADVNNGAGWEENSVFGDDGNDTIQAKIGPGHGFLRQRRALLFRGTGSRAWTTRAR